LLLRNAVETQDTNFCLIVHLKFLADFLFTSLNPSLGASLLHTAHHMMTLKRLWYDYSQHSTHSFLSHFVLAKCFLVLLSSEWIYYWVHSKCFLWKLTHSFLSCFCFGEMFFWFFRHQIGYILLGTFTSVSRGNLLTHSCRVFVLVKCFFGSFVIRLDIYYYWVHSKVFLVATFSLVLVIHFVYAINKWQQLRV
jgi:hypothetical protein